MDGETWVSLRRENWILRDVDGVSTTMEKREREVDRYEEKEEVYEEEERKREGSKRNENRFRSGVVPQERRPGNSGLESIASRFELLSRTIKLPAN